MVVVDKVSKSLVGFAIKELSFHLPKGYIMGLIGPNGAGKTTLLHLLMGLYQPEKGTIKINGYDAVSQDIQIKNEIGCVLTEEPYDDRISLLCNANTFGTYYKNYDKTIFLEYCRRFGLQENKKLGKHSKGEKIKFQLAFALSHKPALLLLDEPTASFDPEFRSEFLKIITGFIADGEHSIILATHLTRDLDRIADYIALMNHGEMLFCMERGQLEDHYRLVSGEDYKLNLLPRDKIIYKEKGGYASKALVRHNSRTVYDKALQIDIPSIEDMMYYILKNKNFSW